jgi:uncharacterized protein YaiL (DUF2058 family)
MGGLKDQLLKSGLVNEKQVKQAQQQKRKEANQQRAQGKSGGDEEKRRIQAAQAEKAERDRQLNLQLKEAAERKAVAAQIRQLIENHRLARAEGDLPFNFEDHGKVKRIYVTESLRQQLTRGLLAIVRLDEAFELVPAEAAAKIRARDPAAIVFSNDAPPAGRTEGEDDAYYAQFEVPDDLIW